jgi:micrococcal nuclease
MAQVKYKWTGSRYVAVGLLATAAWIFAMTRGQVIEGVVGRVVDGDTIHVLADGGEVVVRLWGVDAPESRQQYGPEAAEYTRQACLGQRVRVVVQSRDRYGRVVGEVGLVDGRDLGNELVRNGWAWWYEEYAPRDVVKNELQRDAQAGKIGLWHSPASVPPWTWRRSHHT